MNALDVLQQRVSVGHLMAPVPSPEQRKHLFAAALRVPDHAQLSPWRFLTIEGSAREHLGALFAAALSPEDCSKEALARAQQAPLRAPLIIVVIASPKAHPKVPVHEQVLSAGCAAHALLLAAEGLGLGAMWRTGGSAQAPAVLTGLGLAAHEQIVAFVYVGHYSGARRSHRVLKESDFVSDWSGAVD